MAYASETKVPVSKSKLDIETLVLKNGATHFATYTEVDSHQIAFTLNDRMIRFRLPLPKRSDYRYETGFDQATRAVWRGLLLCIKAKFDSVERNISTFENEFLAHTILPDGQTVCEYMEPQITAAYDSGTMPKMLIFGG